MKFFLKSTGYILLLFLFPLFFAGLFALPAYLLNRHFLSIMIYLGEIAGALFIVYRKRAWASWGLSFRLSWVDGAWSLFYIAARTCAWVLLVPIVGFQNNWQFLIVQSLFFLLLNTPGEELHFRGVLFSATEQMLSRRMAVQKGVLAAAFISSALFALLHLSASLSGNWMWSLVFIADGLAFCALRIRSGSIFSPLIAHAVVNILTGAVFLSANQVADNVAFLYQIAVIIIDLLFFIVITSQSQRQARTVVAVPEHQTALE